MKIKSVLVILLCTGQYYNVYAISNNSFDPTVDKWGCYESYDLLENFNYTVHDVTNITISIEDKKYDCTRYFHDDETCNDNLNISLYDLSGYNLSSFNYIYIYCSSGLKIVNNRNYIPINEESAFNSINNNNNNFISCNKCFKIENTHWKICLERCQYEQNNLSYYLDVTTVINGLLRMIKEYNIYNYQYYDKYECSLEAKNKFPYEFILKKINNILNEKIRDSMFTDDKILNYAQYSIIKDDKLVDIFAYNYLL